MLEETIGETLQDMAIGRDLFNKIPASPSTEDTKRQTGLPKRRSFHTAEEAMDKEATDRIEKTFAG